MIFDRVLSLNEKTMISIDSGVFCLLELNDPSMMINEKLCFSIVKDTRQCAAVCGIINYESRKFLIIHRMRLLFGEFCFQ